METLGGESRLGVGHGAEATDESICDDALLALKDANLGLGVLWPRLGSESLPERRRGGAAAWVEVGEAGEVGGGGGHGELWTCENIVINGWCTSMRWNGIHRACN